MATACYTPLYFPCSYKGVPFEALEASSEHGRRGAEGEFPFGENTAYEDLGRKIRRYNISGRFASNNHLAESALLIAAVETPGPGPLIHPHLGLVNAACVQLSVKNSPIEEQGVTYVELEFVEAESMVFGAGIGLSIFGLSISAIVASLAVIFEGGYAGPSVRYYNVSKIRQTAADGLSEVETEYQRAIVGEKDNNKWMSLARMQLYTQDPSRLSDPEEAYSVIIQSMTLLSSERKGRAKYNAFKRISNWAAQTSTLPSESGDAQDLVYTTFRTLSAAYMARAAMEMPTTTLSAALLQYDEVIGVLEEEKQVAYALCANDLYLELDKFIISTKQALLDRAYKLPALVAYDFHHAVSSLVAAYEIYGNAKKFKQIENRNEFQYPLAMGPVIVAPRAQRT